MCTADRAVPIDVSGRRSSWGTEMERLMNYFRIRMGGDLHTRTLRLGALLVAFGLLAGCDNDDDGQPPAVDTQAPSVEIATPADGVTVGTDTLTVTGTATDNVGVTSVRVNGVTASLSGSQFTQTISLQPGANQIVAVASDSAGSSSHTVVVTYLPPEVTTASLDALQVTGPDQIEATGAISFAINAVSGEASGRLTLNGEGSTAASINLGFAGEVGTMLITLMQSGPDWVVPAGTMLDRSARDAIAEGRAYVVVRWASGREIRGQLLNEDQRVIVASLSGTEQFPEVVTDAAGMGALLLDTASLRVVIHATVDGIEDATAAHLHEGYAGDNGAVLFGLSKHADDPMRWSANFTVTAEQAALVLAGRTYLNFHTPANPGGELRGQILPDGTSMAIVDLSGTEQVPAPVDSKAAGRAGLTWNAFGQLWVRLHTNLAATAIHLHSGLAGMNGGVLVGLTQDPDDLNSWTVDNASLSSDEWSMLQSAGTYLNAHSEAHPAGELRGQVLPDGFRLFLTPLEGLQQVPVAVATSAYGWAAVTVTGAPFGDYPDGWMRIHANTTGVDDASKAHVHWSVAGASGELLYSLVQDPADPAHWSLDTPLFEEGDAFWRWPEVYGGYTYIDVHTPAHPAGELRGQIESEGVEVSFSKITSAQQLPPVATEAFGVAALTRWPASVLLLVNTTGLGAATAAHLHQGFAGASGDVLVDLMRDDEIPGQWWASDFVQHNGALAAGETYVNVHTPDHPAGEVRGQLVPDGVSVHFVDLDGAQEVPPVTTGATGRGAVTLAHELGSIVANLHTSGLNDAIGAHIHEGGVGEIGGVLVGLTQDVTDVTVWSGAATLTSDQVEAVRSGETYLNVHTPANAGGEIRGQIGN